MVGSTSSFWGESGDDIWLMKGDVNGHSLFPPYIVISSSPIKYFPGYFRLSRAGDNFINIKICNYRFSCNIFIYLTKKGCLKMKKKTKIFFSLIIGLLMIQSVNRVAAETVWEEDFETPPFDEWTLQGHEEFRVDASTRYAYPNSDLVPEIIDGELRMPIVTETENLSVSCAIRNSTVAYGTWSFDWEINSSTGTEHETWDNIWFISDMPVNLTGVNFDTPFCEGYVLMLQSASEGYPGVPSSCIYLWKQQYYVPVVSTLYGYDIPGTKITGAHHIDITRNLTGEFNVWFDSIHIFTVTDKAITTSERILFRSHLGDSTFDNITVSDSVDLTPPEPDTTTTTTLTTTTTTTTTTETTDYPQMFVLVFPISVIIILRKKRNI